MTVAQEQARIRRVFVVGCPRSGTTLLQTMLARHSQVFSFPESHFFRKVWGRLWPRRSLGLVSPRAARRALQALLDSVDWTGPGLGVPPYWPLFGAYARAFWSSLDRTALQRGRSVWVEKSPIHLHCIAEIQRTVPDARFLHILRDGRDVVASLYELCATDPQRWVGQILPKTGRAAQPSGQLLEAVIDRWNGDLGRSLRLLGDPRHLLVSYERLVSDTEQTLSGVCAFLGTSFEDGMLRHWEAADAVVGWRVRYDHMRQPFRLLEDTRLRKFHTVFQPREQQHVAARLLHGGQVGAVLPSRS